MSGTDTVSQHQHNRFPDHALAWVLKVRQNYSYDKRVGLYLVKYQGVYVGSCAIDSQGPVAGCYWVAVLPSHCKLGLASLMIEARIKIAHQRGCKVMVSQCRNTSLGLYKKYGFQTCKDMALYRWVVSQ